MVRNLLLSLQLGCANSLRSALALQGVFKVLSQKCREGAWKSLLSSVWILQLARKRLLQELTCTSFSGALHSTFGRRNKGV